jgi:hypothetical protein
LLGLPGNNPYCHYRALELQKQGLQERVVKIREAAPASFAVGEFELITGTSRTALSPPLRLRFASWSSSETRAIVGNRPRKDVFRPVLKSAALAIRIYGRGKCLHCSADIENADL